MRQEQTSEGLKAFLEKFGTLRIVDSGESTPDALFGKLNAVVVTMVQEVSAETFTRRTSHAQATQRKQNFTCQRVGDKHLCWYPTLRPLSWKINTTTLRVKRQRHTPQLCIASRANFYGSWSNRQTCNRLL